MVGRVERPHSESFSHVKSKLTFTIMRITDWFGKYQIGLNHCEQVLCSLNVAISTSVYSTDCRDTDQ